MSKLIVCQGLPGSGKSTWAAEQVLNSQMSAEDTSQWIVRVNQDEIRRELGWTSWESWDFRGPEESKVGPIKCQRITAALEAWNTVISDDTNFGKRAEHLRFLADQAGAEFELRKFLTPVEECIRRDAARPENERVGEKVIRGMAEKNPEYAVGVVQKVQYILGLPSAIICDLDGTLALHNGRSPYDFARCDTDNANPPVRDLLKMMLSLHRIIFMSGRDDSCREKTEWWLSQTGLGGHPLYMRVTGDKRKDSIVKRELFDAHIRGKYNIEFVLDDHDSVVKMWRELGLSCWQVAEGNF